MTDIKTLIAQVREANSPGCRHIDFLADAAPVLADEVERLRVVLLQARDVLDRSCFAEGTRGYAALDAVDNALAGEVRP